MGMRGLLIVSTLLAAWLGMQAMHELGHVAGAWLTGGTVRRVVLHPLTISRTELVHNPQPLWVVWAGPAVGVTLPLALWLVAVASQMPGAFVIRFWAGFCLVANGLYLALGSFGGIGDCGELLKHGAPVWSLWLFGLITAPLGILLWHGQGRHFGLGRQAKPVSPGVAYGTLVVCLGLLCLGFLNGGE